MLIGVHAKLLLAFFFFSYLWTVYAFVVLLSVYCFLLINFSCILVHILLSLLLPHKTFISLYFAPDRVTIRWFSIGSVVSCIFIIVFPETGCPIVHFLVLSVEISQLVGDGIVIGTYEYLLELVPSAYWRVTPVQMIS